MALACAIVAEEVEQPALPDRSAYGRAEIVVDAERLVGAGGSLEEVPRLEVLVVMKLVGAAVDLIGAALGDQSNRRGARHTLLGIRRARGDIDGLDGLFRFHVAHMMREPDVDAGRAIDARDVGLRVAAVNVRLQRAARRIGNRILKRGWRGSGHQVDQGLVVAIAAERHIRDLLRHDLGVRVALVGLQHSLCRFHGNRLGELADLHLHVRSAYRIG